MRRNKKGFTLAEIVTTTAIVGTLAAVALPNFMRVKMNVNMEMVKQQLKILGQQMSDHLNQTNPHQYPDAFPPSGNTEQEIAITASLNGIFNKGYSIDEYTPTADRSNFLFRTCPQDGLFGIVGDRCFILTPMGISESMPWDGSSVPMTPFFSIGMTGHGPSANPWTMGPAGNLVEIFLNDPTYSDKQKEDEFFKFFMYSAYETLKAQRQIDGWLSQDQLPAGDPSFAFTVPPSVVEQLEKMMPNLFNRLRAEGINMAYKVVDSYSIDPVFQNRYVEGWSRDSNGIGDAALQEKMSYSSLYKIAQISIDFEKPEKIKPENLYTYADPFRFHQPGSPLSMNFNHYNICTTHGEPYTYCGGKYQMSGPGYSYYM